MPHLTANCSGRGQAPARRCSLLLLALLLAVAAAPALAGFTISGTPVIDSAAPLDKDTWHTDSQDVQWVSLIDSNTKVTAVRRRAPHSFAYAPGCACNFKTRNKQPAATFTRPLCSLPAGRHSQLLHMPHGHRRRLHKHACARMALRPAWNLLCSRPLQRCLCRLHPLQRRGSQPVQRGG
jgi:hypothetical protein